MIGMEFFLIQFHDFEIPPTFAALRTRAVTEISGKTNTVNIDRSELPSRERGQRKARRVSVRAAKWPVAKWRARANRAIPGQ